MIQFQLVQPQNVKTKANNKNVVENISCNTERKYPAFSHFSDINVVEKTRNELASRRSEKRIKKKLLDNSIFILRACDIQNRNLRLNATT